MRLKRQYNMKDIYLCIETLIIKYYKVTKNKHHELYVSELKH
ncbi:hypothetical protein ACU8KH_04650 [Lachancea thermotolerans]